MTAAKAQRIQPVILSGGAGTRLWPLSRSLYPKQLLPLTGERTLLQQTALRVADPERFAAPIVVSNEEHRFVVAEQLREAGVEWARLILEPAGRNTAPAIALAALSSNEDDLLLVLPSDHAVRKPKSLQTVLNRGARAAAKSHLVTFGIPPTRAETGYGYIRRGPDLAGLRGCHVVAEFVEKPDATAAQLYLSSGNHYWNSGMFMFRAREYLSALNRHAPEILEACRAAMAGGRTDLDFFRPAADAFSKSPAISIDYAVMEHADNAVVVPADIGWSDVGSFDSLWELGPKDRAGNVAEGPVVLHDVDNSYIRTDGRLVAAIGLSGVVLVATDDVVLAVPRDRAQEVKMLVERLNKEGRDESDVHSWVHRPWGKFQIIDTGEGFKAKRLTIKPGKALSLQKHKRRAEHWVVVEGRARVTRDDEVFELKANQSTYIPAGTAHRLENPGRKTLHIIEVQSGSYLGEDDIVRLEDSWGRN